MATHVEHCAGDAKAKVVVRDGTDKGICTHRADSVEDGDVVGYRDGDTDIGDGGHKHHDIVSNMYEDEKIGCDGDQDDSSDDQINLAALGNDVDFVLHGSDDHEDVLDDDISTNPDPQALVGISETADALCFFFIRGRGLVGIGTGHG